jgi:diacylglycerol O-acyltransferase / wax synthase
MTEFMRSSDAFTWAMESDPRLRSTVVTVLLLDKSPDWDDVRHRIDLITRKLPMFRQRVVESPPLVPPRWEYDPDFDLSFHTRRVVAPEPGNLNAVLEMARLAEMEDFDRARPLWRVTQIDGLEDGGAAVLCKFHHSLTDGVGGVQIAMTLFDLSELPGEHGPLPAPPKEPRPQWFRGYRDVFGYDAGLVATAVTGAITSAPKLI